MKQIHISILTTLLKHRGEELTIRAVAALVKKDYKNVYVALKQLHKEGIISFAEIGQASKVELSGKLHPLLLAAEYQRRTELLKNKNLALMAADFAAMRSKLYVLVLFGSYAKGTQTKHSDIDLCFIAPENSKIESEIHSVRGMLPFDLHVQVFSEKEFRAMVKSKEHTVVSEILKNCIILYNVEGYYALCHD
jgi:predicted nucleotidyltransferase